LIIGLHPVERRLADIPPIRRQFDVVMVGGALDGSGPGNLYEPP
jgi:hypothetical protein